MNIPQMRFLYYSKEAAGCQEKKTARPHFSSLCIYTLHFLQGDIAVVEVLPLREAAFLPEGIALFVAFEYNERYLADALRAQSRQSRLHQSRADAPALCVRLYRRMVNEPAPSVMPR